MVNPMDLEGQAILVTGASSGIGRRTSILLSELGAKLVLVGRNSQELHNTLEQLHGRSHRMEQFDLLQTENIPEWMSDLAKQDGPLCGLVHCAGIQMTRPLRMFDRNRFDDMMRLNVTAAIQLTKAFRQRSVLRPPASVVYVSSVMALVGQPGVSGYCATKGALQALARALALELASEGIRINCVAPGHVRTEMAAQVEQMLTDEQIARIEGMHPLGLGDSLDVAHAIAFLLADTGRWITGTTLVVDGGYTAH
jgi:NAD(P)-dependent dehydrogenase (short-subunit alcohol dehydrogenase family)